ncbi:hypothetical protein bAD24_p00990 (plasmid) [Burkholderia sp. AD24]|nr:hypothetical protein bAD24_p00990 [Burkholderia sp. AD24]
MQSEFNLYARTSAVTVAVRPAKLRVGTNHTYELNGTLMHDILVDGVWLTRSAVPAGDMQKHAA